LALVVAGGVEGEFAEEFTVGGDDADVKVGGEDQDAGSGVGAADADVVEAAVVPQGDYPTGVDLVAADAVVAVDDRAGEWLGFRSGGECLGRGAAVQGPVRAGGVVVAAEGVQLGLQRRDAGELSRVLCRC
jgi:hypothetical protein